MRPAGPAVHEPPGPATRRLTMSILPFLAVGACGHGASVSLDGGTYVEGKIVGSDRDRLYLENDDGRRIAVAPERVQDIDHPGTALAITGAAALATLCLPAISNETDSVAAMACLPSLAVLAWGAYLNGRSRMAAATALRERERIRSLRPYVPAPTYQPAPIHQPAPIYQPAPVYPVPYEPPPAPEPARVEPDAVGEDGENE